MVDQAPSTSLNAFIETRINLEPVDQGSIVQIQLPSSGTFSRVSHPQRRVVSTTAACRNEETYTRSCLAKASSIYFSKSRIYPRNILWRVLNNDNKTLELRAVDLSKHDREPEEATVVLQLGFPNSIRRGCVALADDGDAVLSVFVVTRSNELHTLTIPTTFFCDVAASEEDAGKWYKTFSHSSFNLCNPHRLVAAGPHRLVITLDDGSIVKLNRKPGQDGSVWEALTCSEGKWGSSLRGLIRWQGSNSISFDGTVLDPSTAIAAEFSPSGAHLLTVCADHKMKIWNIAEGRVVFSMDLLGHEREPQDVSRVLLDAGNPDVLRIFESTGTIEGDEYYAVTYSPHEGGQFKIWAIRDADQGSLGIRFLYPDDILRPPDPEPGLESKVVWKLADFRICQGIQGSAIELWVLMRSNRRYKTYNLQFDLMELPAAWNNDWTSTLTRMLDQRPLPHLAMSEAQDATELWLEYLLYPGNYSCAILETALSMYRSNREVKGEKSAEATLKDRLNLAVADRVNSRQVKDEKEHGSLSAQYREAMQEEWMLLYQNIQDLEKSSWQALTLALDDSSNMPWLLFAGGCAAIRECSRLESIARNPPRALEVSTDLFEASSIEDRPRQEPKLPHELAILIQAAAGFREAFSPSLRQTCITWLKSELWQEPLFSVPKRIENYYDRCCFAEEISDSAIAGLRDGLKSIGDFDGLTTDHFLAVIKEVPQFMTTERSSLVYSRFGLKVLVKGAQETIDHHLRILSDLLVLITFIEIEVDKEITPRSNLDTSAVFMAIVEQLQRYKLMEWLAENTWTKMAGNRRPSRDGLSPKSNGTSTLTVLETLFAADVRPQSLRRDSKSTAISDAIQDLLVWITGGNESSITLDQVIVNVQCSLLKEHDLELASSFLLFQPSTPWAEYIRGRYHIASGEPTEAALCFQKAAYKMASKPSPNYYQASAGFLSPTEAAHFGQGLPFYYQHISQLFDSASDHSYAAQFAQLALQFTPESSSLEPPKALLTSLFNSSLQTSDIQTAFGALARLPEHDQTNLLAIIVEALLASPDGPKQLLELPWPPHLHSVIDTYLLNNRPFQANSSQKLIMPTEQQRKILAAWRLKRGDFRGAAVALYSQLHMAKKQKQKHVSGAVPKFRLGVRGGDDTDGVEDKEVDEYYLSIINLMACVSGENGGTESHSAGNVNDSEAWLLSAADGGKRKVVTIKDVRKDWQKELDRRSVVASGRWGFGLVGGEEMDLG